MTQLDTRMPLMAALALAVLLAPVALADPPADKGKPAAAQPELPAAQRDRDHRDDKATPEPNHGQIVSTCNHRANEKKLGGRDRQEYLEWCTERGERYRYDDRRYDQDRSCYRVAEQKGMSGDARRLFVENCLRRQEKNR